MGSCNLWCYRCVSTQPGCEEFHVDWRIHGAVTCPKEDDKCVKIIERNAGEVRITRDCLSSLAGYRVDLPADTYEGCRPAARPKVAIYVENAVQELDLKRDHWTSVDYCFCEFDEWCNAAVGRLGSWLMLLVALLVAKLLHRRS